MSIHLSATHSAFSPLDIGGCVLWLRSDLGITKDGSDRVSQWADQSGNGNHATQTVDADKPVWYDNQINGYASVRLDGVSDYLMANGVAPTGSGNNKEFTVVMVVKHISITAGDYDFSFGKSDNATPLYGLYCQDGTNFNYIKRDDAVVLDINGTGALTTLWSIVAHKYSEADIDIVKNGSVLYSAVGLDLGQTTQDLFTIGALGRTVYDAFSNMELAEFIVYNSAISDANRQLLENYLNGRYAIY